MFVLEFGLLIVDIKFHFFILPSHFRQSFIHIRPKSGRVMCFLRSITALILGKAKEPLNVVKMRLALNLRLLMGLLSSNKLSQWLKRYQPFTLP